MAPYNITLARACLVCRSIVGTYAEHTMHTPSITIDCSCGLCIYAGDDKTRAWALLRSGVPPKPVLTQPASQKNTTMRTYRIMLSTPCLMCNSSNGLYSRNTSTLIPTHTIGCESCGHSKYNGTNTAKAVSWIKRGTTAKLTNSKPVIQKNTKTLPKVNSKYKDTVKRFAEDIKSEVNKNKSWTMMKAYEANKESLTCVACDSKTHKKSCFTSAFQYCSCVESLPKG
ncbi:MAG: hypothetical protein KAS32_06875 [Candidatus Peribacteraceae bacterium]|nr:hypothetical protein [Candidatus Peribacteraceae bacterium]